MDKDKQTKFAFMLDEGGLTDDGTSVDPVSGNEVPPGSMAEEVRDDVPAQLSEGEYVVPADVVRFYGVKFFEELRTQAKQGLADMEANGRIGGEPVAMTMDNQAGGDLTPEELAALEQVTGMAMGGMVQQPQQQQPQQPAGPNPFQQQQQMMSQLQHPNPFMQTEQPQQQQQPDTVYAADGVDVSAGSGEIDPYVPQYTVGSLSSMFGPGYLVDRSRGTSSVGYTITLYSPEGKPVSYTLPAQQAEYDAAIKAGYTEEPIQLAKEAGGTRRSDDPAPPTVPDEPQDFKVDLTASSEDLTKTAKSLALLNTAGSVVGSLMGLGGAGLSKVMNVGLVAQYNDIVATLDDRGENTDGLKRKSSIFGGESGLFDNLKNIDGSKNKDGSDEVGFGDTWLGDLLGFDGKVGIQDGPNLKESLAGGRRNTSAPSTPGTTKDTDNKVNPKASTVDTTDDARASRTSATTDIDTNKSNLSGSASSVADAEGLGYD